MCWSGLRNRLRAVCLQPALLKFRYGSDTGTDLGLEAFSTTPITTTDSPVLGIRITAGFSSAEAPSTKRVGRCDLSLSSACNSLSSCHKVRPTPPIGRRSR
jgi:hypothetical protein